MQRTGRTGHAHFRVVAQDSRTHPSSGRVVEYLGSYDPHTKATAIQKEKIEQYIKNGAQPSDTVVKILKKEGVKLPSWVKESPQKQKTTKNPEKLRKNRPEEPVAETPAQTEEATTEPAAETDEKPAEEAAKSQPAEEPESEAANPADEPTSEESATPEPETAKPAEQTGDEAEKEPTEPEKQQ